MGERRGGVLTFLHPHPTVFFPSTGFFFFFSFSFLPRLLAGCCYVTRNPVLPLFPLHSPRRGARGDFIANGYMPCRSPLYKNDGAGQWSRQENKGRRATGDGYGRNML